jgi:hypothetical protein
VVLLRAVRLLASYPRRSPVTAGFLVLLVATHLWLDHALPPAAAQRVLLAVSTNLDNLHQHPLRSLVGSAFFFEGTLTGIDTLDFIGTIITLGFGIAICLAWLEYRYGPMRAFIVFAAGHVGATLLTAPVIAYAVADGYYPPTVRQALDFGISYGAQACLAACALQLPRAWRFPVIALILAWPMIGGSWSDGIPDFVTIGHLLAAAIGFACGAYLKTQRSITPE